MREAAINKDQPDDAAHAARSEVAALEEIFPGDSEMAQRMRERDWSTTALGPVEKWPQSLRTSVSTCLDCAFPILIWWGPEFTMLYNDEYKPILGPVKHPAALGEPGAKVWAEIWDVIHPMLSQVMTQGQATRSRDLLLHIDRGFLEEAYFSFSYSPIRAEGGSIGGLFCPVIETTLKVIGERRLQTLRDLAAECQIATSEQAEYEIAARVLAQNPHDVPFALIYRIDVEQSVAILEATAGIECGSPSAPERVPIKEGAASLWQLSSAASSGMRSIIATPSLPEDLPRGGWSVPVKNVLVLPVLLPGQGRPRAILVAAASPMRELDTDYRTFFELIATQIASGVADAQALETERRNVAVLAELDRAKTDFFSNVSHEFRTPLTLMLGPLEETLASKNGALPRAAAATLQVVHRNSLRLLKLVNNLLDFSRLEAGRLELSAEPTDVAAITSDLASIFRSAIEKAGLDLMVDCPPLPELLQVDRDMWEKVVLNLLSNALKFTQKGTISIALRQVGERVELRVSDTGCGICAEDQTKIFQRFYRAKNTRSRTHEGTGIGLSLVQELVRLHGGEISVQSQEGAGSRFTVSIPMAKAPIAQQLAGRASEGLMPSALAFQEEAKQWAPDIVMSSNTERDHSPQRSVVPENKEKATRPRILLADDNADMRHYLCRIMHHDYHVDAVSDGQTALEQIRAAPPDIVIADVMMPALDGFGLLRAIRTDERTRLLPVILLSARADEEAQLQGFKEGADAYLIKPFSARDLLTRIASKLELHRARREGEEALRQAATRQRFFLTLADRLSEVSKPREIVVAAVEALGRHLGVSRVGYGEVSADGETVLYETDYVDGVAHLVGSLSVNAFGRGNIAELRQGRTTAYADLTADSRTSDADFAAIETRSAMAVPLIREQRLRAVLYLNHRNIREWPSEEVTLVQEVAARTWDALERARAEADLRESEARFRALVEATPTLAFSVLSNGRPEFFNQQWIDYTGRPAEADEGQGWLDIVHPADRGGFSTEWSSALKNGRPFQMESRLRGANGSYRWFLTRSVPLRDSASRVMRWLGSSTDIQDLVNARDVLARSRSELEQLVEQRTEELRESQTRLAHLQRMESLGQLAGGIAHDFNNVLQAVQGGASLIQRRPEDPEGVRRMGRMIFEAAERGSSITRRLLSFSRRADLRAEAVSPVPLLSDLREILTHTLGAGIGVRVETPYSLPAMLVDKSQLETVLVNLATNARDAMGGQGLLSLAAAVVTIGNERSNAAATSLKPGSYVRISVTDTGTGMPPEVLARVTEPFFSTKPAGQGTGLGLAMARGFAEQSGGALRITSELGKGTIVTLWFPLALSATIATEPLAAAAINPEGCGAARLLVVDDEPLVREIVAQQLESLGYIVSSVAGGSEALALLDEDQEFDLLISDLSMPGMDGVTLLHEAHQRRPRLPAILLTGFATNSAEIAMSGAVSGTFSLLRKPINEQQLSERVAMMLETLSPGGGGAFDMEIKGTPRPTL